MKLEEMIGKTITLCTIIRDCWLIGVVVSCDGDFLKVTELSGEVVFVNKNYILIIKELQ